MTLPNPPLSALAARVVVPCLDLRVDSKAATVWEEARRLRDAGVSGFIVFGGDRETFAHNVEALRSDAPAGLLLGGRPRAGGGSAGSWGKWLAACYGARSCGLARGRPCGLARSSDVQLGALGLTGSLGPFWIWLTNPAIRSWGVEPLAPTLSWWPGWEWRFCRGFSRRERSLAGSISRVMAGPWRTRTTLARL